MVYLEKIMETLTEDQKMHRQIAVKLFNHVWELMDNPNRSLEENDEMIHSAHWNLSVVNGKSHGFIVF
jgi:hypothetical protein